MARSKYSIEVMGYLDEQTDMYKVFITAVDKDDVTTIDEHWDTGSVLWDITAKKLYMLGDSGEWVEQ